MFEKLETHVIKVNKKSNMTTTFWYFEAQQLQRSNSIQTV